MVVFCDDIRTGLIYGQLLSSSVLMCFFSARSTRESPLPGFVRGLNTVFKRNVIAGNFTPGGDISAP